MEPITTTLVVLAQIGVSFWNQDKNREIAKRIKEEQRKAKKEEFENNQKRDMEKFLRSCELQERMELDAHKHKISSIKQGFLNSFEKMIHKDNLDKHYHLNISPYIIQRSVIPQTEADIDNVRQELFCILTGSNDVNFNSKVLPYIDESIGTVLSKYWNETSNHTICYYQNMWNLKSDSFSEEDIENLRVLIPTPTVSVTPLFSNKNNETNLSLLISVWGSGNGDVLYQFEMDTDVFFEHLPKTYTKDEIDSIVKNVTISSVCAIGQIADIFYWTNFYLPPLLPILLAKDYLGVPENIKKQYAKIYSQLYNQVVLGFLPSNVGNPEDLQLAKDNVEINLYNHPERSVGFLENIMEIIKLFPNSSSLVKESIISLYRVKTDQEEQNLNQINAYFIQKEDVKVILKLIKLAKDCNDESLAREITGIVKRKIITWKK